MKKYIKSFLLFHLTSCICGLVLYLLLFQIILFDFIKIFFYKGIFLVFLSAAICGIVEAIIKIKTQTKKFDIRDIITSIAFIACINMVWLSSVVVNVDRSFSVWMLSYLDKHPSRYDILDTAFQEQFIKDYGMLDRRLEEQLESNNIYLDADTYRLTKQGENVVAAFKTVGKLYKTSEQYYDPPELKED